LKGNPFKATEFFQAVYRAGVSNETDKRLLPLKAAGLNEAIPSDGGFLVTPDIAEGIMQNMWGIGKVLSRINPINVSGNGLTVRAIDESSRAAGSRMGGVRGYWLAEASDKTSSAPNFRNIDLKLKKVAALVYATDELLQDASALEGWINNNVPNELRFMVEDSFIDGTGIGMPLGILQSGCLVSATRTDASEVDADDIGRMWAARYVGPDDYVWFINQSVLPQLYRMTVANGGYSGVYLPPGGMSAQPYGTLLGRPVIETEYNPYLGTVGDILLASPSQYVAITKGGIQSASSIHVKFVEDETAFRFVMRVDGCPLWSSAVTAFDGTASISPFVALAATT
jgi:HK97 family phage major capsid protein